MNKTTFERRLQQLKLLVDNHPHKKELIALMIEQINDDK